MNAAQISAFQANSGFTPAAMSAVLLAFVFAIFLLWGVYAIRSAWAGWAENNLSQRQLLGVVVRVVAMYLVLTFSYCLDQVLSHET